MIVHQPTAGRAPADYLAQAANLREEAERADDANNHRLAARLRSIACDCEARAYRVENELKRQGRAAVRRSFWREAFARA